MTPHPLARGAAFLLLAAACTEASAPAPVRSQADTFADVVAALSEEGGYFDTDNLISNETSYLHAVTALEEANLTGGAYLGVGPAQNFSYIAALEPELAIIIDIRRDNMLEHLLFKALFELSPTRGTYLANLTGRVPPSIPAGAGVEALVAAIDAAAPLDAAQRGRLGEQIREALSEIGMPLSAADLETIERFHGEFTGSGLDLRFRSHYRAPQPYYPTLRRLLVERDLDGAFASYVASERSYDVVRAMQTSDRIIPVTGDLAGPSAIRSIGSFLAERGLSVTAFYTSNVEFYLFQAGTFSRFVDNVRSLPLSPDGAFVRSYFNRFRATHPRSRPGYASTQLVQPFSAFLELVEDNPSYGALIFR